MSQEPRLWDLILHRLRYICDRIQMEKEILATLWVDLTSRPTNSLVLLDWR